MKINKLLESKSVREDASYEWKPNTSFKHIKDIYNKVKVNDYKYVNNEREEFMAAVKKAENRGYKPEECRQIKEWHRDIWQHNRKAEAFEKDGGPFWYFTKHGLGPGMLPKGVNVVDTKEDNNFGTYIALDKVLTTQELKEYELVEKRPEMKENMSHFEFTSGANPYIAKTKDEVERIKRSRGDSVHYIGNINGIDYYKVDDGETESDLFRFDEAFKPTESGIQSIKCYNRYNYTIQELRVDNDNKTFERGNFTAGKADKKTQNRQEYEDIVDGLKKLGYEEIPSDYRSLRNKSRKGVPTNEGIYGLEYGYDHPEARLDRMQRKTSGYHKCYEIVKKARTSKPVDWDTLDDARDNFGYDLYKMCLDDVLKEMNESKSIKTFGAKGKKLDEPLSEEFPQSESHINLDRVAMQVSNLLGVEKLGEENWIELVPARDSRPHFNGEYIIYLESFGPNDSDYRRLTLTTNKGRIDVAFKNGSEAKCDSVKEIARFIASEYDVTLNESKESDESELITQYINNGEYDKLEKVKDGTNIVWKLKEPVNEASEGFQKEFYNDYVILKNRAGDGWDIYSYDGTPEKVKKAYLEDEGYATLQDAKAEIDKWNSKGMNEDTGVSSRYEFDDDVDDLSYYYDDEIFKDNLENSPYTEIASKSVPDSDGFMTDYTMYQNINTGEYVFVFGDKDVYSPEDGYFDWECETKEEAEEWYNNYHGFDDELDEEWNPTFNEELEESPIIHQKPDGTYLVSASSGDGYTAFNRSNVCVGHITASSETEAKNKFNANKFDE